MFDPENENRDPEKDVSSSPSEGEAPGNSQEAAPGEPDGRKENYWSSPTEPIGRYQSDWEKGGQSQKSSYWTSQSEGPKEQPSEPQSSGNIYRISHTNETWSASDKPENSGWQTVPEEHTAQSAGGAGAPPEPPKTNANYSYGWNYEEYEKAKGSSKKKNKGLMVFGIIMACVFTVCIVALAGVGVTALVRNNYTKPNTPNQQGQIPDQTPNDPNKPQLEIHGGGTAGDSEEDNLGEGELTRKQIAAKVKPSVVGVVCLVNSNGRTGQAYGSGIIMSEDGYIITNAHVIEDATAISVVTEDGEQQYKATLVGKDTQTDLAVLKIEATGLVAAEFGDSEKLEVGDVAVAVGNPYNMELAGTTTFGYISAINRNIQVEDRTMNLIQTDASINPGNSGGPLCNSYGQVVGINTVKIGSGYEGLGFAIPISVAKPIVDDLIQYGYVKGRPLIGIYGGSVTDDMVFYYKMPQGVYVEFVNEGTDAYEKGIQPGDIIVKVDGQEISSMEELNALKENKKAGDTMGLTIYRNGTTFDVTITLSENTPDTPETMPSQQQSPQISW